MKKISILFSAAALILASCAGNPEGKKADTSEAAALSEATGVELAVDTTQSEVKWEGTKVTGSHHGIVRINSGKLFVQNDTLSGGEFTIDVKNLENKDLEGEFKGKLEGHLKSADFFDVEKFPEASFAITKVTPEGPNKLNIAGNLTIRGVSKNISFITDVTGSNAGKFDGKADFNIAREDWGLTYAGKADDLISKEINFKVHLVANKI